jgi:hypothetical protein
MESRDKLSRVRLRSPPYQHFRLPLTPFAAYMAVCSTATSMLKEWVGT